LIESFVVCHFLTFNFTFSFLEQSFYQVDRFVEAISPACHQWADPATATNEEGQQAGGATPIDDTSAPSD